MKEVFLIILLCLSFEASSSEIISGFEFGDNKADKHYIENNNGHIQFSVPVKVFDKKVLINHRTLLDIIKIKFVFLDVS